MGWKDKALTGITAAAGFLCLTLAPTWSMAFLILFGMIRLAPVAAGKMTRRNQASAADDTARAHEQAPAADDTARAHEQAPAADDTSRAHEQAHVIDVDKPSTLADAAAGKPESSSTSSSLPRFKYDVFLNFSDSDTGDRFADHLFRQLVNWGIRVFDGRCDPSPGKELWPEFKEAIEQSWISIAIFSKGFASSTFCLKELVEMWECRKTNGQTIIPIFYDVFRSEVRHQIGAYEEAFLSHKKKQRVDSGTIEIETMGGSCFHFWGEGKLAEEVVAAVKRLLREDYQRASYADDKLVGIDHHVQGMMKKLGVAYHEGRAIKVQGAEVRGVEIWGEQGVGKTTLAKAVFHKMHKLFDTHSFLEIRSEGVQILRAKLIADLKNQIPAPHESSSEETEEIASLCHDKKVLIVLDGVDKDEQIKALAGKLTWFGPGSRIIVTTNKKNIFKAFDVGAVEEHTVKPMDQRHAHKLFCLHAFQGDAARDVSEYFGLSLDIAEAIGGFPSEIVRQASSLREEMNMTRWKTTLGLLQEKAKSRKKPRAFQVSYRGGSERESSI
ncbi:TMV resistance protein N [Eucalyptus grandis]|uniref:TMV resistance protein N n=1 Tax=Eucalyptus grandis TaxID=71139 RepID=UPI00192E9228|nr:TMV resistance protein N [Eucalyptus grandis]